MRPIRAEQAEQRCRARRALLTALAACALAVAGCGGDAGGEGDGAGAPVPSPSPPANGTATATPPVGRVPDAPVPPADAPPDATPGPEDRPGGAGDEEPARVPVAFALDDGGLTPREATVPAFLQFELRVDNRSSRRQTVVLQLPDPVELTVAAGEQQAIVVAGQRPGRYPLEADGEERATLITAAEQVP